MRLILVRDYIRRCVYNLGKLFRKRVVTRRNVNRAGCIRLDDQKFD